MTSDYDKMKAAIVDAAKDVFFRYGYKRATMDDIASSLHMAKNSLYYYFKSKEDVFRAVLVLEMENADKIIRTAVKKGKDPQEKLRLYAITLHKYLKRENNLFEFMRDEMLDVLSFSNEIESYAKNQVLKVITDILEEGNKSGDFLVDDVKSVAELIQLSYDGLYFPYHTSFDNTLEKVNLYVDIILKGICNR